MTKPLLIYDGECRFCCRWIGQLKAITGDRVQYESSQSAGPRFPELLPEQLSSAVQWIGSDGSRASGAQAVFLALATSVWYGRLAWWIYQKVPGGAWAAEGVYSFVARHRAVLSRWTRWF